MLLLLWSLQMLDSTEQLLCLLSFNCLWEFAIIVIDLSSWKHLLPLSPSLFLLSGTYAQRKINILFMLFIYQSVFLLGFDLVKSLFKIISKPYLWNVPYGSRNRPGMKMSLRKENNFLFIFFFQNKANKEMDILFWILAHQIWKQQAWGRSSCCPLSDRKEGELEKTPQ